MPTPKIDPLPLTRGEKIGYALFGLLVAGGFTLVELLTHAAGHM